MDNVDALKLDDIDAFLNEKIALDNEINDENTTKILEESKKLINNLIFQLYYLHYRSLHYDFKAESAVSHSTIKKLSKIIHDFPDFRQSANLSIFKLVQEIDKLSKNTQANDLMLSEASSYYPKKCPLTQAAFTDPYTQRFSPNANTCNHSFEREAIARYLTSNNKNCPIAGCGAHVNQTNLIKDWDLLHRIYISELKGLVEPFINPSNKT